MTESPESATTASPPSLLRWPKAVGLLIVLIGVLWVVGSAMRLCVAEVGVYLYDDDLVEGGQYLARVKQREAYDRMYWFGLAVQSHHDNW